MGAKGMPRRYYSYIDEFQPYHVVSTSGTWILSLGFIVLAYCLYDSLKNGEKAPENPWGALTLEWKTATPPILHNFEKTPIVNSDPYDYELAAKQEGK